MFDVLNPQTAMLIALLLPFAGLFGIKFFGERMPNGREATTLITGLVVLYCVLTVFTATANDVPIRLELLEIMPGMALAFEVERLGAMFALIASGLWVVNSLYSIGYMRGTTEKCQTRFYMCFAVAISAAIGAAYAANLLTLFLFYEVLTLSTFPLVTHKGDENARRGGTVYLGILLGTSIGLFLPAVVLTYAITGGNGDFVLGGILQEHRAATDLVIGVLLLLFAYGIGKAALMPIHPWLPNAMVAPTPVSAFLHAVAVVKAGVFALLKVAVYIFGIDYLKEIPMHEVIMWLAAGSILLASAIAMTKDNLKARLAYSTVSQLSYVTLGAMMATSMGAMGAGLQIAAHALGKMTLFMCAGAIYVAHHKALISQMRGLGRQMPFTFMAFLIGACSIIGLPPLAGSWPKFFLLWGAADAGQQILFAVLIVSSLMNIIYLLTPIIRGFMDPRPEDVGKGISEAPLFCLVPAWITATGCLILFFNTDALVTYLTPVFGQISIGG